MSQYTLQCTLYVLKKHKIWSTKTLRIVMLQNTLKTLEAYFKKVYYR